MRLAATFAIPAAGLAAFGWLAIPAEAVRSCSSAHNECKNYCNWTNRPVEKGLEKR